MFKKLIATITILLASVAWGGTVVEDLVNFVGAGSTLGLSLKYREMSEGELRAELDRRLATKLLEITEEAKAKKITLLRKELEDNQTMLGRLNRVGENLIRVLALGKSLKEMCKKKLKGQLELSDRLLEVQSILHDHGENVSTLSELYRFVENQKQGMVVGRNVPDLVLISEELDQLAASYNIRSEEYLAFSVSLSDQESVMDVLKELGITLVQLKILQVHIESEVKYLESIARAKREALGILLR